MMEQGVNTKRLLITIAIILATSFAVGGSTYYVLSQSAKKEKEASDKVVQNLESRIKDLEKGAEKKTASNASTKTEEETKKKDQNGVFSDIKFPIISFSPDTFSDDEKNELLKKIIDPFVDYRNMVEQPTNPITVVSIQKYGDLDASRLGYTYSIDTISKNLGWGGWLERPLGKAIRQWVPECMGSCSFTDAYKTKYPEVFTEYNNINP